MVAYFRDKVTCVRARREFPAEAHIEPTRSRAAKEYVWKEDTAVAGTQFEFGVSGHSRGSTQDWEKVVTSAKAGNLDEIPADILVRYYGNLRKIMCDNARPVPIVRKCRVFIGPTGTGKSRLAWEEAGPDAYVKDPRTKWFDGYNAEKHVIIDEFRGTLDVTHLLRWFDRYPCRVEIKGSSVPLLAEAFWICSNTGPSDWYPELDQPTMDALLRRLEIVNFPVTPFLINDL